MSSWWPESDCPGHAGGRDPAVMMRAEGLAKIGGGGGRHGMLGPCNVGRPSGGACWESHGRWWLVFPWHFSRTREVRLGEGCFKLTEGTLSLLFPAESPLSVSAQTSWKTLKYLLMLGTPKALFLKANQLFLQRRSGSTKRSVQGSIPEILSPESCHSILQSLFAVFNSAVETETRS